MQKLFGGGPTGEGLYEVLDYEVSLDLLNTKGTRAKLRKREQVRYLQNHIIAYQDQAWGDGDNLVNYRCSPGKEVDRYQLGYKTQILISLRKSKNRGEIDEFLIEREIHNGFLQDVEYLELGIDHRTKRLKLNVTFPSSRPPTSLNIVERLRKKESPLPLDSLQKLPDEKWLVSWEISKPKLHEHYILRWEW